MLFSRQVVIRGGDNAYGADSDIERVFKDPLRCKLAAAAITYLKDANIQNLGLRQQRSVSVMVSPPTKDSSHNPGTSFNDSDLHQGHAGARAWY